MPHLPPHDSITASVQCYPITTGGSSIHGLVELNFGAPTPSRSQNAKNGIYIQGDEGYLFISQASGKLVISVNSVQKNDKGEDVGEKEEVVEEKINGVFEELKSFFGAVSTGKVGGEELFGDTKVEVGKPENALIDVAFIQAGLTSEGKSIDLNELIKSG